MSWNRENNNLLLFLELQQIKISYRLLVTRPRITIHEQLHYGVMIVAFRFLQRGTMKLEKTVQIVLVINIMVIDVLLKTRKKTKDERH